MRTFHIRRFNQTLWARDRRTIQAAIKNQNCTQQCDEKKQRQMSAASEIDFFFFSKRPLEDIVFRFDVLLHLSGTL